jgi:hypothetical protein
VAIAVDDTRVYWLTNGTRDAFGNYQADGALLATPLEGGPITTIAENLFTPDQLLLEPPYAYFMEQSSGTDRPAAIVRVPLAGGTIEPIAGDLSLARGLAIDGNDVYWLSSMTVEGEQSALYRAPKDGSGTPVMVMPGGDSSGNLLSSGGTLYWVDGAAVRAAPPGATEPTQVLGVLNAYALTGGTDIAMHGGRLYFLYVSFGEGGMGSVLPDGSGEAILRATMTDSYMYGLAVDASGAYFSYGVDPAIWVVMRTDLALGEAQTVLQADERLSFPQIALTDTALYLTAHGGEWGGPSGVVLRVPKPL